MKQLIKTFLAVSAILVLSIPAQIRADNVIVQNDPTHSVPTLGGAVTPHTLAVAQSTSASIPVGTHAFVFVALTGTVTLGGAAVPLNTIITSNNTLKVALAYTTATTSTAFLYYETN